MCQSRPGIADGARHTGANNINLTVVVLKQKIRETVAIKITGADKVQSGPQIPQAATPDYVGAVDSGEIFVWVIAISSGPAQARHPKPISLCC